MSDIVQIEARKTPRKRASDVKVYGRTKIANGSEWLSGIDQRSLIAKRYREIGSAILIDQGGDNQCSESRKQLIRRFAAAAVLAEQMEAALANGAEIDITQHALLCSTLVRVANKLGLDRASLDVTPPDPLKYKLEQSSC